MPKPRVIVPAAMALVLSACLGTTRDPIVDQIGEIRRPTGNWRVERQVDRITGQPISNAWLKTDTSSNSNRLLPASSFLEISCFRDREPMITFHFLFRVGTTQNAVLAYRFDDKPGREAKARFIWRDRKVVIEDKAEAARFLDEMAAAQSLYIRIRSINAGRSSAEFRLDGAPMAIEMALARCHKLPEALRPRPEPATAAVAAAAASGGTPATPVTSAATSAAPRP